MCCQHITPDPAQIKTLASGQDSCRHFADFGSRKNEFYIFRRLFQRLQQCIKCIFRQHMHFINNIDFINSRDRAIGRTLNNLAHIIHTRIAGCIHFQHINMFAFANINTILTLITWLYSGSAVSCGGLTVQPFGNNTCGRGFAYPSDTGKHKSLRNPSKLHRIC